MRIAVKLFAAGRQLAGTGETSVELGPGSTVGDLRRALAERHASLAPLVAKSLVAVNAEYADDATAISAGDEAALIPPVSGG
jgi:molybdopterin converting factor subunit 1